METRFLSSRSAPVKLDKRAEGKQVIAGYGAVYYDGTAATEYPLWSDVVERIMPGAFSRVISEQMDVRGLFNHNADHLLGRVAAKTLRLSLDAKGLAYEIDAPDTQVGRDTVTSIERGDLTGSSFSFVPTRVMWVTEEHADVREIHEAIVYDLGPVTWPAYEGTTAQVRSHHGDLTELREQWRQWKEAGEADEIDVRLRMLDLDR
jgi:HK97 family phage prohead protease